MTSGVGIASSYGGINMWKDKIVEGVRKTREKILKDANYDITKILNEILEMQKKDKDRIVALPLRKKIASQ